MTILLNYLKSFGEILWSLKWQFIILVLVLLLITSFQISASKPNEIEQLRAEQLTKELASQEAKEQIEKTWITALYAAQRVYETELSRINAKSALLESNVTRLSDTIDIAQRNYTASSEDSRTEYAFTVSELFKECIGRYQWLAEEADKHLSDKRLLISSWPTEGLNVDNTEKVEGC